MRAQRCGAHQTPSYHTSLEEEIKILKEELKQVREQQAARESQQVEMYPLLQQLMRKHVCI